MPRHFRLTAVALVALGLVAAPQAAPPAAAPQANSHRRFQATPIAGHSDAQQTRGWLMQILRSYPPSLHAVLRLDPALLSNDAYMASYPALVTFLAAHPEVAHNPSFYIGTPDQFPERSQSDRTISMWESVLGGLAALTALSLLFAMLVWLIRTFLNARRWARLTKIQTDVHTKLMDRFTGNEELLAYIQSPAGRKFLESTPISLEEAPRSLNAPLGRILLSLQIGIVVVSAGIGLQYVSGHFPSEIQMPVHAMGVLGQALGIGFIIAAGASYLVSWRLGLVEKSKPVATPDAAE
jgi:hypothetical protein